MTPSMTSKVVLLNIVNFRVLKPRGCADQGNLKTSQCVWKIVNFINVFPLYERKLLIHYQKLLNWVPNICIIHLYNMCPALLISALTLLLYLMNISNICAHKLTSSQAHKLTWIRMKDVTWARQSSLWLICYVNINIAQTQYGRRPRQAGMEDQDVSGEMCPLHHHCHVTGTHWTIWKCNFSF